uniref:Uncharacterized protein n=1 Tax=Arcella intermedia TaxID=1963864 RepID=A0A6B2LLF4_9EUKA
MMGSGGVGKSTIFIRYYQNYFVEEYDPTIEDAYRKCVDIDGKVYAMEALDTPGTQQFTAMRDLYIKNAEGIILIYSIIAHSTFVDISELHSIIMGVKNEQGCLHTPIIIAANKLDLQDQRVISTESGQELANQLGCAFMETSAKTPTNVTELFDTCARMIIQCRGPKNLPVKKKGGGCQII